MTPRRRENLLRLLKPRSVAVIGGRDAETVARGCLGIGFRGALWPVNPKRQSIAGHPCFPSLDDLPEAPDAAFVAVPRDAAIEAVDKLSRMGAGGAVCYTAGFGESGEEGAAAEARLVEAAGDLALIGPNCYGLINYVDQVALWPFAFGGACPGYGAAIVTQSGMLSSDLTMSQRSVPFAYMISAGNQSVLHLEDFVDLLAEQDEVRAIGLHIEGLRDIGSLEAAARKALERRVPIVALKTGTSEIGARLTVSHTGSLSGSRELYEALFHRLGIIQVTSPSQLLETLKFLCVAGIPKGSRVAGFTCSGGGATMLADHAQSIGLQFPQPSADVGARLRNLLPFTATVSNPLDYTTPIWGIPEKTRPVFDAFLADAYDAAVIVQDFPAPGLDESKPYYLNDSMSFMAATAQAGIPAAVCSTLPENLDAETRATLLARDVAPMQGIHECLNAIAAGCAYWRRREALVASPPDRLHRGRGPNGRCRVLEEGEAKRILAAAGIAVPEGLVVPGSKAPDAAARLGFPVALKMMSDRIPHKTEAGAVCLGLSSGDEVGAAVSGMWRDVNAFAPGAARDRFLVERMIGQPVAELMVSVRRDPQFGLAMTVASGGILVELVRDAATVLLPASRGDLREALERLRISRLLRGYRGKPGADIEAILAALQLIASHMGGGGDGIAEVEINPLYVLPDGVVAVDVLMQVDAAST